MTISFPSITLLHVVTSFANTQYVLNTVGSGLWICKNCAIQVQNQLVEILLCGTIKYTV